MTITKNNYDFNGVINEIHNNQMAANLGYNLAKVGVEGSNPFARSKLLS